MRNIKEKREYILTPVSETTMLSQPNLNKGYTKVSHYSKKTFVAFLALFSLLSVMFVGMIQTSKPAQADILTDTLCNTFFDSVYGEHGSGAAFLTVGPADIEQTLFRLGKNIVTEDSEVPLTAYEMYGVQFTSYTSWSARTSSTLLNSENIGIKIGGVSEDIPSDSPYWSSGLVECLNPTGNIINAISNTYLSVSKFGLVTTNTIYIMIFGGGDFIFNILYGAPSSDFTGENNFRGDGNEQVQSRGIVALIDNFKDLFFVEYLALIIVLGAIWMAWQGLIKRKTTQAFQGALWMIGAAIFGMLFLTFPLLIPSTVNTAITEVNKAVSDVMVGASNSGGGGEVSRICDVGDSSITFDDRVTGNTEIQILSPAHRKMQCLIWYNVLYTPWVAGQYGIAPQVPSTSDGGKLLYVNSEKNTKTLEILEGIGAANVSLGGTVIQGNDLTLPLVQLESQRRLGAFDSTYYNNVSAAIAYSQLVENKNITWAGRGLNMERPSAAFASIFAMLGMGLLIVVYGLSLLTYQISMLLLVLLMPLFLFIGVHPGFGRRLALRWAELVGNVAIKQILIGVILSIILFIFGIILGSQMWLMQLILIIAVTIAGLIYKNKIMDLTADIKFQGSSRALEDPLKQISGVGKQATAAVVGLGAGAVGASIGGPVGMAVGNAVGGAVGGAIKGSGGSTADTSNQPAANVPTASKSNVAQQVVSTTTTGTTTSGTTSGLTLPATNIGGSTPQTLNTYQPKTRMEAKTMRIAEYERLKQLKVEGIKKAAWAGAKQGWNSSGSISSTAWGAAKTGFNMGGVATPNDYRNNEGFFREVMKDTEKMIDAKAEQVKKETEQNTKEKILDAQLDNLNNAKK
jgi:hypothetical protein